MNYILYGPDTYRSRKKLNEIIEAYQINSGVSSEVHYFDADENDPANLKKICETNSLFVSKKLVVVSYALSSAESFDAFASVVEKTRDAKHVILVLWDHELDPNGNRRLKTIEPYAVKIQEFTLLAGEALRRWISEEAKKRSMVLSTEHITQLVLYGGDLWRTANELEKLSLDAAARGSITQPATNIFTLGDTFFGNECDAIRNLLRHLEYGEDDFGIFSYLANHTRTLCTIKSYMERNRPVSSTHKIHPFVVKKASLVVRSIPSARFTSILGRFFEEDHKIKTGLSRPGESLVRIRIGS